LGSEARHDDGALSDRVDLTVGTGERRHDQRTAAQGGCIAQRTDVHVDAAARAGKGRQVGSNHHSRRILRIGLTALRGNAKILQHRAHGLFRERRGTEAIAGALETDDQAIADQLVVASSLQGRDVLDSRGHGRCRRDGQDIRGQKRDGYE
jgi:hypothetical protein